MVIEKIRLDEMYRSYATSHMPLEDKGEVIFVASEEKGYPCYMYYGDSFQHRQVVWSKGGGCMGIIPIPGKANEFLAIMDFYLKETPSLSKLVHGQYIDGEWKITDLFFKPYLHRFDIFNYENKNYLVCATIADLKDYKDDWSRPGSIYVAILPEDLSEEIHFKKIKGGMFINHGYYKHNINGKQYGFLGTREGIYKLTPAVDIEDWNIELIHESPISEIAFADINGDGKDELITIEPFHGDTIKIYEQIKEKFVPVYDYPYELNFGHTLTGATLNDKTVFVGGIRRVNPDLFYIIYDNGEYKTKIIDKGCGPANVSVFNDGDRDIIVSANHTANEAAVYIVTGK